MSEIPTIKLEERLIGGAVLMKMQILGQLAVLMHAEPNVFLSTLEEILKIAEQRSKQLHDLREQFSGENSNQLN